ncbi:glycerate kinase [Arthrobacter bambusae]|uniref:glycerate kinase n=1 Tax=Arthrobacter bambusae TaxID=1338426 RepID=UPI0027836AD7|nr:glycerate kinase [Arthrobacter bambusae]MDQ0239665.1 glycerate kinase [Arthrobacter bambusae]
MTTTHDARLSSRPLRILVAPDKFKGSLTAGQAADAIAAGVLDAAPESEITLLPVADGGEGTIDALVAAGADLHHLTVSGPLGEPVEAAWASLKDTAVIEMAQAAGLQLIPQPSAATAEDASTYGVGQLILDALDSGFRKIIVAAGGVASTDAGVGALWALGLTVLDPSGTVITHSSDAVYGTAIDGSTLDPRLAGAEVVIATDVCVPLVGERGAAHLFGPQKGADPVTIERLERRLERWNGLFFGAFGVDASATPGVGAAGGFAVGFLAAGVGRIAPGIELIGELIGLDAAMSGSDLVIVGEGSLDDQSLEGKAPIAVARAAMRRGIPVLALSGIIQAETRSRLHLNGICAAECIRDLTEDRDDAIRNARPLLRVLAARAMASRLV